MRIKTIISCLLMVILWSGIMPLRAATPAHCYCGGVTIYSVQWSPDNTKIAYNYWDTSDGGVSLKVVDVTSEETWIVARQTTTISWEDRSPQFAWLPDSESLLFLKDSDVYHVSLSNMEAPQNLTSAVDDIFNFALSPSGEQLALRRYHAGEDIQLYLMNMATQQIRPLALPEASGDALSISHMRWADGDHYLGFMSAESFIFSRVDVVSGDVEQVNLPPFHFEYSWSHHGRYLAYGSIKPNDLVRLYVADLDTGEVFERAADMTDSFREISWSPDDTQLAYLVGNDLDTSTLFIMQREGNHFTSISEELVAAGFSGDVYSLTWTPAGLLTMLVPDTTLPYAMLVRDPDNAGIIRVSNNLPTFHPWSYNWSHEGSSVAINNQEGEIELHHFPAMSIPWHMAQGEQLFASGDISAAIDTFSWLVDELNYPQAYFKRATAYIASGQPDLAAADYLNWLHYRNSASSILVMPPNLSEKHFTFEFGGSLVQHWIRLNLKAGQQISVIGNAVEGTSLDPLMIIMNHDRQALVADDNSGGNGNAAIHTFEIPADDTYFIVIGTGINSGAGRIEVDVLLN